MSRKRLRLLIVALAAALTTVYAMILPKPTVIVARVGMSFDEVVRRSSYPVLANAVPPTGETGFGAVYVSTGFPGREPKARGSTCLPQDAKRCTPS